MEAEISIDLGEPFVMSVSYDPKNVKFEITFNKDKLDKYTIAGVSFLEILEVAIIGDMTVNFVGFINEGN